MQSGFTQRRQRSPPSRKSGSVVRAKEYTFEVDVAHDIDPQRKRRDTQQSSTNHAPPRKKDPSSRPSSAQPRLRMDTSENPWRDSQHRRIYSERPSPPKVHFPTKSVSEKGYVDNSQVQELGDAQQPATSEGAGVFRKQQFGEY